MTVPSDPTDAPYLALLLLLPAAIPHVIKSVLFLLLMLLVVPKARAFVLQILCAFFWMVAVCLKLCDTISARLWHDFVRTWESLSEFLAYSLIGCLLACCAIVGGIVFLSVYGIAKLVQRPATWLAHQLLVPLGRAACHCCWCTCCWTEENSSPLDAGNETSRQTYPDTKSVEEYRDCEGSDTASTGSECLQILVEESASRLPQ